MKELLRTNNVVRLSWAEARLSEAGIDSLQGARKWWQFPQQLLAAAGHSPHSERGSAARSTALVAKFLASGSVV